MGTAWVVPVPISHVAYSRCVGPTAVSAVEARKRWSTVFTDLRAWL